MRKTVLLAVAAVVLTMGLNTGGAAEALGCIHGGNPSYQPDFRFGNYYLGVELRAPRLNKRSVYFEVCGPDR